MNNINQMITGTQIIAESVKQSAIGLWLGKVITYAVAHPIITIAVTTIAVAILIYCIYKYKTEDVVASKTQTASPNTPPSQKPQTTKPNNQPVQTAQTQTVREYKGDLSELEKEGIKTHFKDDFNLKFTFKQHENFNLSIRRENIFESQAEVIVNAANDHLGGGGGIDGAIHKEGGDSYAKAHRQLKIQYNSQYISGHAAMVESGQLKEKYKIDNVIIVAGPSGETSQEKENELYSCYFNSLLLAHSQNKKSIAFPSISTGIFGFPKIRATAISLKATHDFINQFPETTVKTVSIHFLANEPKKNLEIYSEAVKS